MPPSSGHLDRPAVFVIGQRLADFLLIKFTVRLSVIFTVFADRPSSYESGHNQGSGYWSSYGGNNRGSGYGGADQGRQQQRGYGTQGYQQQQQGYQRQQQGYQYQQQGYQRQQQGYQPRGRNEDKYYERDARGAGPHRDAYVPTGNRYNYRR